MDQNEFERLKDALKDTKISDFKESEEDSLTIDLSKIRFPDYTNHSCPSINITGNTGSNNVVGGAYGNVTLNSPNFGSNGNIISANGGGGANWSSMPFSNNIGNTGIGTLNIDGENADIMINGRSLKDFMEKMEDRLAILTPDLEKLEHFAALKKAYEHYKTLEALCEIPKPEDNQ